MGIAYDIPTTIPEEVEDCDAHRMKKVELMLVPGNAEFNHSESEMTDVSPAPSPLSPSQISFELPQYPNGLMSVRTNSIDSVNTLPSDSSITKRNGRSLSRSSTGKVMKKRYA